ncbi:unnamed protein product [Notodromas monacha]|uniref:Uncharacterized protein n=1 Tax=Notodromas monacha TaxID=399045 RepID=A0A7R9GHU7_9CRUS|nr:unnamed protein product [Notodromas monacha]CAG0921720.1 unnamed protein product [Notodromas monacha]
MFLLFGIKDTLDKCIDRCCKEGRTPCVHRLALNVEAEKTQQAIIKDVEDFERGNLKHTQTAEKNTLPDKEVIEQEKKQEELKASIETFDATKLKHTETEEKNPLPTQEDIQQEKTNA